MIKPRYSIIPAGAVFDHSIERGDLRVLCLLGCYTDKLGWCFVSQVTMAEKLGCSRSTVQRALGRLIDAGWVALRDPAPARPYASHAYRVIMDRDDPDIGPSELEVEDQKRDGGCPPAGTGVPSHDGQGCPPSTGTGVPTHTRAHNDQDSELDDEAVARARDASAISEDAHRIAAELAKIAGHDPAFLPPRWVSDGPAMRVQQMLGNGWTEPMMIENARAMMAAKRDGPPYSIRYFEPGFATAHARQSTPPQLPTANPAPESNHDDQRSAPDWKASRDNWRRTVAEFGAAVDEIDGPANPGGQGRA